MDRFCVSFANMCLWSSFQIEGAFFVFFENSTFWGQVFKFNFEGPTFRSISKNSNFKIPYFEFKRITSKSQKVKKQAKLCPHQPTGYYDQLSD